jgi:hypothetical protein
LSYFSFLTNLFKNPPVEKVKYRKASLNRLILHQESGVDKMIGTNSEADADSDVFKADDASSLACLLPRVVHPDSKPFVPSGPLAIRDWAMI